MFVQSLWQTLTVPSTILPDVIALKLHKMSPCSKVIEMPDCLTSTSDNSRLSTNSLQSNSRSLTSFKTCQTQQHRRQTFNTQRSLWILGNRLIGTIEYETSYIALAEVSANESDNEINTTPHVAGKTTRIRVCPASWLMRKAWEALSYNVYGKWTYSFRNYNLVHRDSPVIEYTTSGDLNGLRDLFERKQATPFDTVERSSVVSVDRKDQVPLLHVRNNIHDRNLITNNRHEFSLELYR